MEEVRLRAIVAHVVGEDHIESVITRTSAEKLALKTSDAVRVVV